MHFVFFENLHLQYWDWIYILNERGEGLWGNYIGDYDRNARTFIFQNAGNGQKEIINISDVQNMRRG